VVNNFVSIRNNSEVELLNGQIRGIQCIIFAIYLILKNATNKKYLFKVVYMLDLADIWNPCAGGFKDWVDCMESG
jgi:hypothetical protein